MAGGARAQFDDVLGLGEVHFEERADAGGQGQQVEGGLGGLGGLASGNFGAGAVSLLDGGLKIGENAGFGENIDLRAEVATGGGLVAVQRGEGLDDLRRAAMAVQVAEAANVHENVEAESRSGVEGAQGLVVTAAVA